jgi:hypothetical protein
MMVRLGIRRSRKHQHQGAIGAFSCGNISKAQVVKTSIFRRGISGVTFSHTFTSAGDEPRIKADSSNP